MITLPEYKDVHPYILESDRGSDEPTIFGMSLLESGQVNYWLSKYAKVSTQKGNKTEIKSNVLTGVEVDKLVGTIQYIENIAEKDGTIHERVEAGEEDLFRKLIRNLDSESKDELLAASSSLSTLTEGFKKKLHSSPGSQSSKQTSSK